MPMTPDELSELKTLMAAARKKPLNFGICIGKKPDSLIFYLHRKKAPDILARLAKKAGDTSKVAMGTASVSGKKLTLTIIGDPPSGMAKRTKVFLIAIKMPFKVELISESGEMLESDGEDDDDQKADSPATDKTDSAEPKGPTREEIAAFNEAFARANAEVKRLRKLKVNTSDLKANLAAVSKLAKDKKIADAMFLLTGLSVKFSAAEQSYCIRMKKRAQDAIDRAKTHKGAALEVKKLEVMFKSLEDLCDDSPVNSKKISAVVKTITRREKQLKRAAKRYKKEYSKILKRLNDECTKFLNQIDDPLVAKEKAIIIDGIKLIKQKLDEHSPSLAKKMIPTVHNQIYDAVMLTKAKNTYLPLEKGVLDALKALNKLKIPGIAKDCKRLMDESQKAAIFKGKRAFYDATLIINKIKIELPILKKAGEEYAILDKTVKRFRAQQAILEKSPQFEFIQPEYNALMARFDAAAKLATNKELIKAVNAIITLTTDAKMLEVKAAKSAPFTDFKKDIDNGEVDDLRKQAEALLASLQRHPRAKLAPHLLADVKAHIESLDSFWNQWSDVIARSELKKISDLATQAKTKLDNADAYYTRAVTLEKNTAQLGKSHPQAAYIRPIFVKIAKITTAAKAAALASANGIDRALTEGESLRRVAKIKADDEVKYRAHRATTEASLTALSAPGIVFPNKEKVLVEVKEHIDSADTFSKTFLHSGAEKALGKADTLIMTSNIATNAKAGTPPDIDAIKKLLAQPNGQKALDDLVAGLPDSTQQDVMKNVLEARFGTKVNIYANDTKAEAGEEKKGGELNVPAPRLLEYYEVLKSVPASHTNLNPSLLQFDSVEEDKGGEYDSRHKRITIQLDDDGSVNMATHIGDPDELDKIDTDCVCPSLGPDEPNQASWTTYHEIGHAVDDRKKFMEGKAKDINFGGWVDYGTNVAPVAAIAAAHFKFDPSFVERTMAGGNPKPPKIPPKLQEKEGRDAQKIWEKRQDNFEKWLKAVSVGSKPWSKASVVNEHKIKGVMYQEAYKNNWVSYVADARKKGIRGYQFRAPGEWFADLYAAYHTKKISSTHPANSWLATL